MLEKLKGQSRMGNSKKLATLGTQDEDKQNTKQYVFDTTIHKTKTCNANYLVRSVLKNSL